MKTQKHYLLGFDVTKRKSLYAEIDALTEENREQAAEIVKLQEKIDEQTYTIGAQKHKINMLDAENLESFKKNDSLASELHRIKVKATEFEEKYNAAVKYQQNTQAAYDELKADYEKAQVAYKEMKADYDLLLARTKWGYTEGENKNKVAEADAVPTGCETAKTIGAKDAQSRGKNGRFEKKHKRADDPRK